MSPGDLAAEGTHFAEGSHSERTGFQRLPDYACTVIPCLQPSCARTCSQDMHCWYQNRQSFQFFRAKRESWPVSDVSSATKSDIFFFFNHRGGFCFSSNCGALLPYSHYAEALSEGSR